MSFGRGLAVYDFDDQRNGAGVVRSADKEIVLSPGSHALITASSAMGFEYVNPAQVIPYGVILERNIGNGLKAYTGKFSLPHALNAVLPLKDLVRSSNPQAQKVAGRMLKTTAILMQIGSSSNYRQMARPQVTAYQQ